MEPLNPDDQGSGGVDRRAVLRRGAVLGGAMVWTVPAVQSLAGPAFAAGSPCVGRLTLITTRPRRPPVCTFVTFKPSTACCDCIAANSGGPGGALVAALVCTGNGSCVVDTVGMC